ncbi:hypothetical protein D3C84_1236820 [compost metagenome]
MPGLPGRACRLVHLLGVHGQQLLVLCFPFLEPVQFGEQLGAEAFRIRDDFLPDTF